MKKDNLIVHLSSKLGIELVKIQGGLFYMGSDGSEANEGEKPAHKVRLSDFYMTKYQVTQDIWQAVMGDKPSRFTGEKRPVEQVSWNDVQKFLKVSNKKTGKEFRLPTEAEWEYGARGGRYSEGYKYAGSDRLKQVGWYDENSKAESHEVGRLLANELGLHDMSGNVWEWCHDRYSKEYYVQCRKQGVVDNPVGPDEGENRVFRGGSWSYPSARCRSVHRNAGHPVGRNGGIGFRLVLPF